MFFILMSPHTITLRILSSFLIWISSFLSPILSINLFSFLILLDQIPRSFLRHWEAHLLIAWIHENICLFVLCSQLTSSRILFGKAFSLESFKDFSPLFSSFQYYRWEIWCLFRKLPSQKFHGIFSLSCFLKIHNGIRCWEGLLQCGGPGPYYRRHMWKDVHSHCHLQHCL